LTLKQAQAVFAPKFDLPSVTQVDAKLVAGAALFGLGWGLGGICPGPAVVSLASDSVLVWTWMGSALSGMQLHSWLMEK